MTIRDELAALLNGRDYRDEITKGEEKHAKESGLIVIFGASDDLMEARGAIYDEYGAYEGGKFAVVKEGSKFDWYCEEIDEIVQRTAPELAIYALDEEQEINEAETNLIEAVWDEATDWEENGVLGMVKPSWHYKTNIPHSRFAIKEDGDYYCIGIVIDIKDLK